jgi:hypothetical protein
MIVIFLSSYFLLGVLIAITRPGRQKSIYISALIHNECVALVGEAENVGGELIQPQCGGLWAG